ncbi:alpha-(1,3)-fucosyltransferase 7-like [Zophobas morio]|uniref:alpha-(1,3)-fucosyltransferase 7-like n=1 Tax=Zophobas morio TaxID=2755281 RepID=UPI003082E1EF
MVGITNKRWFILLATATTTMFLVMVIYKPKYYEPIIIENNKIVPMYENVINFSEPRMSKKPLQNWRGLTKNQTHRLSVLGRILFLQEDPPQPAKPDHKYQILVWKYGKTIENRHLKRFGKEEFDPFEDCSVRNCEITYEDAALTTADLVIFHLHRMKKDDLPKKRGPKEQIWAFLTDESPNHTFLNKNNLTNYNGLFNWSMTYRMDSDIPVPYGRTILRQTPLDDTFTINKRKDVLVAILGSNCGGKNKRWDYVKELKKHIAVDVYGGCGTLKCPGHFKTDCPAIDSYLFYLAFENSNCDEYVTEKLWWNAFEKNSIPIVMGATKESYAKLLPPKSYLNIDDYAQPKDLATHIHYLNMTGHYREYFEWKRDFEVLNEHGYFQSKSYHYCRVCEALNYNTKNTKIYQDLSGFWSVSRDCHPAWNA